MNQINGLALSGGGSKGLLHVGAIKYFEDNNIDFTVLSGTSVGSIIGGLYACGKKSDEILKFFETTKMFSPKHIGFNYKGIINTVTLREEFESVIENPNIEDLQKNIHIVSTNLLDGTMKVFEKGNLIDAILASSAYPGVFTPMKIGNSLYSDGGMVNNFPIDLIKDISDVTVGINLSTFEIKRQEELKNMVDIISRSFEIISNRKVRNKDNIADINLSPTFGIDLGTFETKPKRLEEIYEMGFSFTENYFKNNPEKLSLLKIK